MKWFLVLLVVALVFTGFTWLRDRYVWNNGVCRRSGQQWKLMAIDEDTGERTYYTNAGYICTIGWKVEKPK